MRKIRWSLVVPFAGLVGFAFQSMLTEFTAQLWEAAYDIERSAPRSHGVARPMKLNDGGWFVNLPDGRGVVLTPKGDWYTSVFRSEPKGPKSYNLPKGGQVVVFPVNGERECIYGPMRWPARKNGMCYLADAGLR